MRRVVVIGSGGAGKSTFARELAARTGLPLVHLDQLYWRRGWVPTPLAEWEGRVRELVAAERWLLDGNYGGTLALRLEAADTAVFLDVQRRTCLLRVLRRRLLHLGRTRNDVAPGCPERLTWEFVRWIWTYPVRVRPRLLEQLAQFDARGGNAVILRNSVEARAFLAGTRSTAAGQARAVSIAGHES